MKKSISDVVSELEIIKKSHVLNNDSPLISIGDIVYSIDDAICILKNDHMGDELYKSVKEGLLFL